MGDFGLGKVCFDEALEDLNFRKYRPACVGRCVNLYFF